MDAYSQIMHSYYHTTDPHTIYIPPNEATTLHRAECVSSVRAISYCAQSFAGKPQVQGRFVKFLRMSSVSSIECFNHSVDSTRISRATFAFLNPVLAPASKIFTLVGILTASG